MIKVEDGRLRLRNKVERVRREEAKREMRGGLEKRRRCSRAKTPWVIKDFKNKSGGRDEKDGNVGAGG